MGASGEEIRLLTQWGRHSAVSISAAGPFLPGEPSNPPWAWEGVSLPVKRGEGLERARGERLPAPSPPSALHLSPEPPPPPAAGQPGAHWVPVGRGLGLVPRLPTALVHAPVSVSAGFRWLPFRGLSGDSPV